jgi:hypothetical protein
MMETGELFVVYRECDEDRSSEAAMGEGGARSAPLCELKKAGARSARARTRDQNPLGHFAGFSLHTISFISLIGSAQLRWQETLYFRVPRSSFRVRRSSVGCSVAQKDVA